MLSTNSSWLPLLALTLIWYPTISQAAQVPYLQPSVAKFKPKKGRYATTADDYAAKYCTWLGAEFPKLAKGWEIESESSFGQFYPAGSNPSLELLIATYPSGIINSTVAAKIPDILTGVGPDIDLIKDEAYGLSNKKLANHGPLGGLPPFCRYGAFVKTSDLTKTLFEVWLPLQLNASTSLVAPNVSDFPTGSTPILIDGGGKLTRVPLNYYKDGEKSADDDAPAEPKEKKKKKKKDKEDTAKSGGEDITEGEGTTNDETKVAKNEGSANDEAETSPSSTTPKRKRSSGSKTKQRDNDSLKGSAVLGVKEPGWNGRLLQINNGGQRGSVPLTDLKQGMVRFGFAVSGSNAGHFGTTGGVDYVIGPQREETIRDLAHRSHYVTTVLSRQIVDIFYGPTSGVRVKSSKKSKNAGRLRAYLAGVSVGGAGALGAVQQHGDEWDGVLVGAPALFFSDTNFAQVELAKIHRKESSGEAVFNATIFQNQFHKAVLQQCDKLDGVKDGILTEPEKCKLDFEKAILCGGGGPYSDDKDVCFTKAQVNNLKKIYSPFKVSGKSFYPGFPIGVEASGKRLSNSAAKAINWVQKAIQGKLDNDNDFAYSNGTDGGGFTIQDVRQGRELNIGESNFAITDLSRFFSGEKRGGGKILHYHGLADLQINPRPSVTYYEHVESDPANGGKKRVRNNYKLYLIPGMDHGRDGPGAAWHFGGLTQNDAGNRPYKFETKFDMLLALVAWVEQSMEPTYQIGVGYGSASTVVPVTDKAKDNELISTFFESYDKGVTVSRKHCPYPQVPKYKGGPTKGADAWKSFTCA